jgi:hypothetical protein
VRIVLQLSNFGSKYHLEAETEKMRQREITPSKDNNHKLLLKFWNMAVPLSTDLNVGQATKMENIQTSIIIKKKTTVVSSKTMHETRLVSKSLSASKKCDLTCNNNADSDTVCM